MFDIAKAVKAAMDITPDPQYRAQFARFVERSSRADLPVTQWRTVGKASKLVKAFLDALGFGEDDYEAYVSRLDPSVVDFRWGTTGKYERLVGELAERDAEGGERRRSSSLVVDCWLGKGADGYCAEMDRTSGANAADEPAEGEEARTFPFRAEENTKAWTTEFLVKANEILAGLSRETPGRTEDPLVGTCVNGVAVNRISDLRDRITANLFAAVAVPNLEDIETMVRVLRIGELPETRPDFQLFGRGAGSRYTDVATWCRHMRPGETIPGYTLMLGGIVAHDIKYECDSVRGARPQNPLRGYLYNDADTFSKVKPDGIGCLVGFSLASLDNANRTRTLAYAAATRRFWTYVAALYRVFTGLNAGIEFRSRLGFGPSCNAFVRQAGCSGEVLEEELNTWRQQASAVFAFMLTEGEVPDEWNPARAMDREPLVIRDPSGPIDVSQFCSDHVGYGDREYQWFSLVHHAGEDVGTPAGGYRYAMDKRAMPARLAKLRARETSRTLANVVKTASSVRTNRYLSPNYDRYGNPEHSYSSAFVSGVARLMKRSAAGGQWRPKTHPDGEGHPNDTVVSNVYTCGASRGLVGADYRHDFTPAEFDAWRDRVAAEQTKPAFSDEGAKLMAVVETNVDFSSIVVCHDLIGGLRSLVWNCLVWNENNPDSSYAQNIQNNYRLEYVKRAFEEVAYSAAVWKNETIPGSVINVDGDSLSADVVPDAHGRANVVVRITGKIAEAALAHYRVHAGIQPVAAYMLDGRVRQSPDVIWTRPAESDEQPNYDKAVDILFRRGQVATDWESPSIWPKWGIGQLVTQHRGDALGCPARECYIRSQSLVV